MAMGLPCFFPQLSRTLLCFEFLCTLLPFQGLVVALFFCKFLGNPLLCFVLLGKVGPVLLLSPLPCFCFSLLLPCTCLCPLFFGSLLLAPILLGFPLLCLPLFATRLQLPLLEPPLLCSLFLGLSLLGLLLPSTLLFLPLLCPPLLHPMLLDLPLSATRLGLPLLCL